MKENYAVYIVRYNKTVSVDGTIEECLSTSQTTEYKNHLGSSYGGGNYFKKENLDEFKESVLSWFKSHFSMPYVEFGKFDEKWYGYYISDIKSEDITLRISEESIKFLKRNKFPLDELLNKIEELRKNRVKFTKEYLDKIEMWVDIDKFVYDTEWQIKDLVNAILDKGKTFKAVMNIEEIWNKINDLIEQLRDIDEEYSKLHRFFHTWDRHTFVCSKDEDWFWQRYEKAKKIVFGGLND